MRAVVIGHTNQRQGNVGHGVTGSDGLAASVKRQGLVAAEARKRVGQSGPAGAAHGESGVAARTYGPVIAGNAGLGLCTLSVGNRDQPIARVSSGCVRLVGTAIVRASSPAHAAKLPPTTASATTARIAAPTTAEEIGGAISTTAKPSYTILGTAPCAPVDKCLPPVKYNPSTSAIGTVRKQSATRS
ncbi:hypothetical protein [Salmonirosea aquatica]|uniref:hypothetical protein n=1 Tax=Salmonirosea aquatica TaxID=2654236 RepID=UPI0035713ABC